MRRLLPFVLALAASCGGATPQSSTTTGTSSQAADAPPPVTNPALAGTWRWGHGRGARADGIMVLRVEAGVVSGATAVDATHEGGTVAGTTAGDRVRLVFRMRSGDRHIEATIDPNGLSGTIDGALFWAIRSDEATLDLPDGGVAVAPPPPPQDAGAVIVTSLPLDAGQVTGVVVPIPGEDGGAATAPDAGRVVVQHIQQQPPPPGCNCGALCYCGGMAPGPEVIAAQQQARRACAGYACPPCPYCPPLP